MSLILAKYQGGGSKKIKQINKLMGPHEVYCESFGGMANFLLNKKPTPIQIVNDKDPDIYALYHTIKHNFPVFQKYVTQLTYDEETFWAARLSLLGLSEDLQVYRAINKYVLHNMSRGGEGKDFAWSERLRRGMPGDLSGWLSKLDKLPQIHEIFKKTEIFNRDALEVIEEFDGPDTLHLLDPPFFGIQLYNIEFDRHTELLDLLGRIRGRFILLGYQSPLYEYKANSLDWGVITEDRPSHMSNDKTKKMKTDVIWTNFCGEFR